MGAVAVQMALARDARVIASASDSNLDYLREIGAIPVRYGEGVADRVQDAAGGRVDAVLDVAGKTPIGDLVSLVPEPSQVVSIANVTAGQAGARVTGGGADSRPAQALALAAKLHLAAHPSSACRSPSQCAVSPARRPRIPRTAEQLLWARRG